jgi:methionine-rich copper-binding protein CopC
MRSPARLVATTTVSLCLMVTLVTGARAHAIVITSEPADGRTGPPPHRLLFRFNSRIEKSLCSVVLAGPRQAHIVLLRQETRSDQDALTYPMPALSPGTYQARWKALSADGHLTEGTVSFSVKSP